MLKDNLERLIEKLVPTFGWRVQLAWWQHIKVQWHQPVRAKFIQDDCEGMTQDEWYEWFNTLTSNEFIHVMLLDDDQTELVDEIVDALSPEDCEEADV